jgi:aspartyl-tRNA synthetase
MTWHDALDRYGTDKPDLRFGMELIELTAVFEGTEVKAFSSPAVKGMVVTDGAAYTRSRLDELTEQAKKLGAAGLAWFRVVESGGAGPGPGLEGPLARHLSEPEAVRLLGETRAEPGDLVLIVSDEYKRACEVMGGLRTAIGAPPVGQGPHRYVWVVDFPMFEGIGADGNPQPAHHPFTMPYAEDLPLLETDPFAVRSQAYDLVLNGWELGSGSVRIHQRETQERVFAALGIEADEAQRRFGFLLGAFRYGAPPHAGFAFGVDRLAAILAGEENIREVIAYPKTQSGADLLTGAPAPLPAAALVELGIRVVVPPGGSGAPGAPTSATTGTRSEPSRSGDPVDPGEPVNPSPS